MSLPGVESARRRRVSHGRFPTSSAHHNCTTRSSWSTKRIAFGNSLYPTNNHEDVDDDNNNNNNDSSEQRQERAMEARNRLHEKLRSLWPASSTCRSPRSQSATRKCCDKGDGRFTRSTPGEGKVSGGGNGEGGHPHVLGGQAECPVCLDAFLGGQRVISLPCRHSFHSECLIPWLLNHRHCPLCRANILLPPKNQVDSSLL